MADQAVRDKKRHKGRWAGLFLIGFVIYGAVTAQMQMNHTQQGINKLLQGEQQAKIVSDNTGHTCWAEVNDQMPDGYEVICK